MTPDPDANVRLIRGRLKATEHAVARLKVDTGLMFTDLARNCSSLGEARRFVERARRSYRVASQYSVPAGGGALEADLVRLRTAIADIDERLRGMASS